MTISYEDFREILLRIVKQYPYNNSNRFEQPQTFATNVGAFRELYESNIGKTYDDFEKSEFWTRDWSLMGSDANELYRAFPLVSCGLIGLLPPKVEQTLQLNYKQRVQLSVFDLKACETCEKRTIGEVHENLTRVLLNILNELSEYYVFTHPTLPSIWGAGNETFAGYTKQRAKKLSMALKEISPVMFSELDDFYIANMTITIDSCLSRVNFNYSYQDSEKIPIVKCNMCP